MRGRAFGNSNPAPSSPSGGSSTASSGGGEAVAELLTHGNVHHGQHAQLMAYKQELAALLLAQAAQ